jgi:hypothetical protein
MPLKQSQASWRKAHGFGVLCIHSPLGECSWSCPTTMRS